MRRWRWPLNSHHGSGGCFLSPGLLSPAPAIRPGLKFYWTRRGFFCVFFGICSFWVHLYTPVKSLQIAALEFIVFSIF
jgi:hypothetical protein